jgi:serine/threonine-protein kinase
VEFDALWTQLKLDSVSASAPPLEETRRPDWEADTVASGEHPVVPDTTPVDTRLSLSQPPSPDGTTPSIPSNGDLVVVGELGRGGMGSVLLARQPSLDRDVAVKVPLRSASEGTVHALVREARTTGSLEHPGIVPVHAIAFDQAGTPALVMKRIDGVSWATLLKEPNHGAWRFVASAGRDRLESQVQLLMQVCNAVAFAHRQGVLHRDIKPANVLIGEFGEVYLADWGVATKKPMPGEERRTGLVGTPLYFAPEMVTGDDHQMDERTDVYLLGGTLYHALTGWPPHPATDLKAAMEHAWAGQVPPLPPEVPPELAQVILRALHPDKAQRFQTAGTLRDALAEFLRHRGSHRLAAAAIARLEVLEAELAKPSPTRERIAPLVSECRFGFMQALAEWPENPTAGEGLERCLRAAAWFEVKLGNAPAARALLSELKKIPSELVAAIRALELDDEKSQMRKEHFQMLEREMDPRVAIRQRTRLFLSISAAVILVTLAPLVFPGWRAAMKSLGHFELVGKLLPALTTFAVALMIGRRSLLGTILNRRIVSMMALCFLALAVNRITCAVLGLDESQTLTLDEVVLSVIGAAAGLMFHWGFFISMGCNLVGLVLALLFPEHTLWIFGAAEALGLSGVLLTWTRWRSELVAPIDRGV